MLRVEMLSTGDEVLHGQIIDTNAAWLADYLFQQGMPMSGRETVGDSLSSLIETLQERSHIADVLIVNGGWGRPVTILARWRRPPLVALSWLNMPNGWRVLRLILPSVGGRWRLQTVNRR